MCSKKKDLFLTAHKQSQKSNKNNNFDHGNIRKPQQQDKDAIYISHMVQPRTSWPNADMPWRITNCLSAFASRNDANFGCTGFLEYRHYYNSVSKRSTIFSTSIERIDIQWRFENFQVSDNFRSNILTSEFIVGLVNHDLHRWGSMVTFHERRTILTNKGESLPWVSVSNSW